MKLWLEIVALAVVTAAPALEIVSPIVVTGEPVHLAWFADGQVELAGELVTTRGSSSFGPYRLTGGSWALTGLDPGAYHLRATLTAGGVTEQAESDLAVLRAPLDERQAVERRLPHLAAAWQAGRAGQMLLALPPAWLGGRVSFERELAAVLPRPFKAELAARRPPGDSFRATRLLAQLPNWLAAYQPDLVVLGVSAEDLAAGYPPDLLADLFAALVADVRQAGADAVVLGPLPSPDRASWLPTWQVSQALSQRLSELAWVVSSSSALWPTDATGLGRVAAGLAERLHDGALTAAGQVALTQHLLDQLGPADSAAPTLAATLDQAVRPASRELLFGNPGAAPTGVNWTILSPAGLGPEQGYQTTLAPGATARLSSTGDLSERFVAACYATLDYRSGFVTVPLERAGLDLEVVPGRRVCSGSPAVALQVGNQRRQSRAGRVSGAAGLPSQALRLAGRRTVPIAVAVLLDEHSVGRLPVRFEAVADEDRATAAADLLYARAIDAGRQPVTFDGVLDEWRGERWYSLETEFQQVAGDWSGPADAGARFALRSTAAGLALALTRSDDATAPGDAVELWWDTRAGAALGTPGRVRHTVLKCGAAQATGELSAGVEVCWGPRCEVAEVLLPWSLLELTPRERDRLVGFDLALRDADPGGAPALLVYSGLRWAELGPARLGLLRLEPSVGPAPVRLWVVPQ